LNRDNHQRVYDLAKKLRLLGWYIWIDEEDMIGNIDAAMASGIDNAEAVIICLTEEYCLKINQAAKDPRKRDNCLKEWTYTNARNKLIIPIVMEPDLLNINNWPPGIISLQLGSTIFKDGSDDNLDNCCIVINNLLLKYGLTPNDKLFNLLGQVVKDKLIPNHRLLPVYSSRNSSNTLSDRSSNRNSDIKPERRLDMVSDRKSHFILQHKKKLTSLQTKLLSFLVIKERIQCINIVLPSIIHSNTNSLKKMNRSDNLNTKNSINYGNNYLKKMREKWKTTGQLKEVCI
jgi:hypothetical protein